MTFLGGIIAEEGFWRGGRPTGGEIGPPPEGSLLLRERRRDFMDEEGEEEESERTLVSESRVSAGHCPTKGTIIKATLECSRSLNWFSLGIIGLRSLPVALDSLSVSSITPVNLKNTSSNTIMIVLLIHVTE